MKALKLILGFLFLLIGGLLILFAGFAYIIESSPWHSVDYFGLVFTLGCGIPGIILLTIGILSLKQRRVLFAIFGSISLLIFLISLFELFKADSYTRREVFGLGICWLVVGVGYLLSAYFIKNKETR